MTIKEEINQLSIQEIQGYAMRGTPAERAATREIIDEIEADGVKCVSGPWWGGERLHRRHRRWPRGALAPTPHRHPPENRSKNHAAKHHDPRV